MGMIEAEAYSDDHAVEVTFDAERWFKEASDEDIVKLAQCGFGGDYPADVVAQKSADWNIELSDLFTYVEARHTLEAVGFECHVNEAEARVWLAIHKPELEIPAIDE